MTGEVPAESPETAAASQAPRQWRAVHGRERPAVDARSAGRGGEDTTGTLGTAETDLAGGDGAQGCPGMPRVGGWDGDV